MKSFVSLLFLAVLFGSCVNVVYHDYEKAEAVGKMYHHLIKDDNFDKAYNLFSPGLKEVMTLEHFKTIYKKFYHYWGDIESVRYIGHQIGPATGDLGLLYEIKFDKVDIFEPADRNLLLFCGISS